MVNYNYGAYSECNDQEQWIRITEGCPHNCPYCYEPQKIKDFGLPIILRNKVKIMDMNLLCKPRAIDIIKQLGSIKVENKVVYSELICGIDYRFLTQEIANALKKNRFKNIRLAWDWGIDDQYKICDALKMLITAGYKSKQLMMFMICNWKISYKICCKKLDLLKVWNVKVADCYFDNQVSPNIKPIHWTEKQIKSFRKKCRDHNILINFGVYADKASRR